jgi:hypothetical protein
MSHKTAIVGLLAASIAAAGAAKQSREKSY